MIHAFINILSLLKDNNNIKPLSSDFDVLHNKIQELKYLYYLIYSDFNFYKKI